MRVGGGAFFTSSNRKATKKVTFIWEVEGEGKGAVTMQKEQLTKEKDKNSKSFTISEKGIKNKIEKNIVHVRPIFFSNRNARPPSLL